MARELPLDDLLEREAEFRLVGEGDGAEVRGRAVGEDGADGEVVGAEAGFRSALEVGDVGVDGVREERGGVFLPGGGEDHGEEAFGLCGEVGFHVCFEGAVVGGLVGVLDGGEVGVGAGDDDVVEEALVRADALEGFVEEEDVVAEGAAQDGQQAEFDVGACFGGDVGFEGAFVALLVSLLEVRDQRRGVVGESADERCFVGAEALHGFAEGVGGCGGGGVVDGHGVRAVAGGGRGGRRHGVLWSAVFSLGRRWGAVLAWGWGAILLRRRSAVLLLLWGWGSVGLLMWGRGPVWSLLWGRRTAVVLLLWWVTLTLGWIWRLAIVALLLWWGSLLWRVSWWRLLAWWRGSVWRVLAWRRGTVGWIASLGWVIRHVERVEAVQVHVLCVVLVVWSEVLVTNVGCIQDGWIDVDVSKSYSSTFQRPKILNVNDDASA